LKNTEKITFFLKAFPIANPKSDLYQKDKKINTVAQFSPIFFAKIKKFMLYKNIYCTKFHFSQ